MDQLQAVHTSSEKYTEFLKSIETLTKPEDKIKEILAFMRDAVSTHQTPVFRDFWDAKRACLELFKEKIPSRVRLALWKEYTQLSDEVRKLKDILDEQSSFAQQQILLAIDALEKDIGKLDELMAESSDLDMPTAAHTLLRSSKLYVDMQHEIGLFNAFAGRLNGLRKELVKTAMRIKTKNQLFDRLGSLGRAVFPRRKELIQTLSDQFLKDVNGFIETSFPLNTGPYFTLKEEIKAFQHMAKQLTLSTETFFKTRELLSVCWDQIKEQEKAFREKKSAEKVLLSENYNKLLPRVEELQKGCETGELTLGRAEEIIQQLLTEMKELELGHADVKDLKKRLFDAKRPLEEKEAAEREKRQQAAQYEKVRQKEEIKRLNSRLLEIVDQAESISLDVLVEKWEACVKEEKELKPEGLDQSILQCRLGMLADYIQEKTWQELRFQEGEDVDPTLHALLENRHKERRKVKEALESHRKIVGGSSLSLEESLRYQDLISEEKMRQDSIETLIEEIEEKLFNIEE